MEPIARHFVENRQTVTPFLESSEAPLQPSSRWREIDSSRKVRRSPQCCNCVLLNISEHDVVFSHLLSEGSVLSCVSDEPAEGMKNGSDSQISQHVLMSLRLTEKTGAKANPDQFQSHGSALLTCVLVGGKRVAVVVVAVVVVVRTDDLTHVSVQDTQVVHRFTGACPCGHDPQTCTCVRSHEKKQHSRHEQSSGCGGGGGGGAVR